MRQLIGTGAQQLKRFRIHIPIQGPVDHGLRVLHTEAHGEILCLHVETLPVQRLIAVPGTVADGEDNGMLFPFPGCVFVLRVEADLAAEGANLLPEGANDGQECIGAYMGLRVDLNVRIRAALHKFLQHEAPPAVGILHQGIELTVRKGTGTALTELGIGLRIELSLFPKRFHILDTLLYRSAALINHGTGTGPCQEKSCQHARRAEAHDDGTVLFLCKIICCGQALDLFRQIGLCIHGFCIQADIPILQLLHELFLVDVRQLHNNSIREIELRLFPSVNGSAKKPKLCDLLFSNMQERCAFSRETLRIFLYRKLYLVDSDHILSCSVL